jgi:hypothetical protein
LCFLPKSRVSGGAVIIDQLRLLKVEFGKQRDGHELACSFFESRSMSSWKPKTMMSGLFSDVRTEERKEAFSVVLVRSAGLQLSMFHEQERRVRLR